MNAILRLRKKAGLSQHALAVYIGVSRSLVKFAERDLRELPKEATKRLENIEKVVALDEFNGKQAPGLNKKIARELKEYHKGKIQDYLYKAEGLAIRLSAIQKVIQKSDAKVKLVNGLMKANLNMEKTVVDIEWTKYHEMESNNKHSKQTNSIAMLQYEIDVLKGYAAVHKKILKKII